MTTPRDRKTLYFWILKVFNETYDIERPRHWREVSEFSFTGHKEFKEFQWRLINQIKDDDLNFYVKMALNIGKFKVADEESMFAWPASGFYFDREGNVVMYHEC